MSRSAEKILEFDKLRELVRGRSTCAPGKRALDALVFSRDREKLERGFAVIREAREWLRGGKELGFGALSAPEDGRAGNSFGSRRIPGSRVASGNVGLAATAVPR